MSAEEFEGKQNVRTGEIYDFLLENDDKAYAVKELAEEFDISSSTVSYHRRKLRKKGVIKELTKGSYRYVKAKTEDEL